MKLVFLCLLFTSFFGYSQTAMSFEEAKQKGISPEVDKVYKGALGDDGVFKTEEEQQKHIQAYQDFLKGLGVYLESHNFKWDAVTKGFNRIYMRPDGTIDYFLYAFKDLSKDKEKKFRKLLGEYIKSHKFGITAPVKFAQCSPVTYSKTL